MLTMRQINHILGLTNQRARDSRRFGLVGKDEFINTPVNMTNYDLESKLFISYSYDNNRYFSCIHYVNSWCREIQHAIPKSNKARSGIYFYCFVLFVFFNYFMFRNKAENQISKTIRFLTTSSFLFF